MKIEAINSKLKMKNALKHILGIISILSITLVFFFVPQSASAQQDTEVLKLNETVGVHVGGKINNNGDVLWTTHNSGAITLNFYNNELDTTYEIYTTNNQSGGYEVSIGQYNLNDLGDIVWEAFERTPSGSSLINSYNVYYKAYDSENITFLGKSKTGNLGSSGFPSLPKINNNRLIVTKNLLEKEDLAVTRIPETTFIPITQNLTNNNFRTRYFEINDNNIIAYNFFTNHPLYTSGNVRVIRYHGTPSNYYTSIWSSSINQDFTGTLTNNDTLFFYGKASSIEIHRVECSGNTCQDTTIASSTTDIHANDGNHAIWTMPLGLLKYYNNESVISIPNENISGSPRIGGDNEIVWYENHDDTYKLIYYDTKTGHGYLLFETSPGERISGLEISNAGHIIFNVVKPANWDDREIYLIRKPIFNSSPTANAGEDQSVNEGDAVTFDGSLSSDPDGVEDIASYEWELGDGNTASGAVVNHTYLDDGIYTATLTVTDTAGETDTDTVIITVNNVAPIINSISPVEPVLPGVQISTNATFSDAGVLDTHTATWSWGDGNFSAGVVSESNGSGIVTGSHTYSSPGVYTVTLTVNDGTDTGSQTFTITILTASQAINDLVGMVETFNLQQGIQNSLDAKLDAALNALDDLNANNNQAAINSLYAFINSVEAQRGNKITNEQADILIAYATEIIAYLNT